MAKKPAKKVEISNAQKLSIGVGLTAAAVTAAGAYFLYGSKDAAKNRKKVKSWSLKAKAEVLEALENAKEITQEEFSTLVNGVTDTYTKVQKLSKAEAKDFKNEMMANWQDLMKGGVVKAAAVQKVVAKVTAKKASAKKAVVKSSAKKVVTKAVAKKTVSKK